MSGHTAGKWYVEFGEIVSKPEDSTETIRLLKAHREPGCGTSPVERDENIKRAALCVNFLDGFSNEELERMVSLLETIRRVVGKASEPKDGSRLDMYGDASIIE